MKPEWKAGDRIECDMSFIAAAAADGATEGFIAGVASSPTIDAYGHKVAARAFDDSIRAKGLAGPKGVKLLAYHDWGKPAGLIQRLETVGEDLKIEAQLNMKITYVRDMYEAAKQNGGLNFSVGFMLEDFEWIEDNSPGGNEYLLIKKGDLMEVSIVCFPACRDATMDYIKNGPINTLAEFERALVANGLCKSRNEANRLTRAVKASAHLFLDKKPSGTADVIEQTHPLLDASKLKPVSDLIERARAALSSR